MRLGLGSGVRVPPERLLLVASLLLGALAFGHLLIPLCLQLALLLRLLRVRPRLRPRPRLRLRLEVRLRLRLEVRLRVRVRVRVRLGLGLGLGLGLVARTEELVDDALRRVGEVAELRLP